VQDASTPIDASADAADAATPIGPGGALCSLATPIPLNSPQFTVDVPADTTGAPHTLAAPCATNGAEVFYKLSFSKPVVLYADTFGASYDTVLYLLSSNCSPLTGSTMPGDAVCSAGSCGTQQSQLVALLNPGIYKLAVSAAGSNQGPVDVHVQWALSPSGSLTQLAPGSSSLTGNTAGTTGNIDGMSSTCIAAGPEQGYWWAGCPSDPGGALSASTCGGSTWQSLLELQVPGSIPYTCDLDTCGLQTVLDGTIPAGPGLRVLCVDGEAGNDSGPYKLSVTRP